ncbi:bleomycin resistance protein [Pseudomonas mosselii]|uniref:bleomycin resistance protein n=1 Tax=Pseudomonas mosselii TaxID=78327 RepID=UPI000D92153F|nr:VOC family protein [Pseudomonas mosselii]PYC28928.1 bleomycin resistance family protein [Pseudomonas mosselii]
MLQRNKMVPELIVSNLDRSLEFWVSLLGFEIAYQRPEQGFAYLDLQGAQVMLEQFDAEDHWLTGPLEKPLGRGINLQIDVAAVAPLLERLERHCWPLFQACEDVWYRADLVEVGLRQFLVQDPDGYLLRLAQRMGERPAQAHRR